MVVLDTNMMSLLEWRDTSKANAILDRLDNFPAQEIATTIITFEEQARGWLAYIRQHQTNMVKQIRGYRMLNRQLDNYRWIQVLDFDEFAALEFQSLKKRYRRFQTMDLKIAAIVKTKKAILITENLQHFAPVTDLPVENWL